jgi:hypothetical protein
MPGTLKRIRDEMDVRPAPRDKGLTPRRSCGEALDRIMRVRCALAD